MQDYLFKNNITIGIKWWKENLDQSLPSQICNMFEACLYKYIVKKYSNHWFINNPLKGQGYRSISFDRCGRPDPLLVQVAEELKLELQSVFPKYLESCTMWIDPDSVIVKSFWSYSNKATEEILFPKPKYSSGVQSQYSPLTLTTPLSSSSSSLSNSSPVVSHLNVLQPPLPLSPVKSPSKTSLSKKSTQLDTKQLLTKSSLNQAEALLWKQFCGGNLVSENNIEPSTNRIYA